MLFTNKNWGGAAAWDGVVCYLIRLGTWAKSGGENSTWMRREWGGGLRGEGGGGMVSF